MRYRVLHRTQLAYAAPIARAQFNLRLVPWPWPGQRLERHHLTCWPEPAERHDFLGPYCVNTSQIRFAEPLHTIEVVSEFTIELDAVPVAGPGPRVRQVLEEALAVRDLSVSAPAAYLFASGIAIDDEAIAAFGARWLDPDQGVLAAAEALMGAIHREFSYQPGTTTSSTSPAEAFAARSGVCQDFAHVMIVALRSQGIPAAYASGYLRTIPPPGAAKLVGADAMHAWAMVWCGQALGWVGLDPTNNCLASSDHILIAMGRDYADVAPIDGTFIGSVAQSVTSTVDVECLNEDHLW